MTHQDAQREARRRWGAAGSIEYRGAKPPGERYAVGTKGGAPNGIAYGKGASYEEAFADADRYSDYVAAKMAGELD